MAENRTQPDARETIEALVREALAHTVADASRERLETMNHSAAGHANPNQATTNSASTLTLSERLVTTATLTGRLRGMTACRAPVGAIVTPAARDLLRERRVKLEFATPAEAPKKHVKKHRLILAIIGSTLDAGPLAAALACPRRFLEVTTNSDLLTAVEAVIGAVRPTSAPTASAPTASAIVLTSEAAAAVCLVNRAPGMRAAQAASARDVAAAIRSLGPNVLIVDPTGRSYWELLQITKTFAAAGASRCPERWNDRLK